MSLLIASNRGPISFNYLNGELRTGRGGGGLASGLLQALNGTNAKWISAATSLADRAAIEMDLWKMPEVELHPVILDTQIYESAYNKVSNETLWFMFHGLFNAPYSPVFDRRFFHDLDGYYSYNQSFAETLAKVAASGDTVFVNDYHLLLVPKLLRSLRKDISVTFFLHTPFPSPEEFSLLPSNFAHAIISSLCDSDLVGFHADQWRTNFRRTLDAMGFRSELHSVVAPLPTDSKALEISSKTSNVLAEMDKIQQDVGEKRLLVRVDRMELSKNIVRGFLSIDELLLEHPEIKGEFIHMALCYPSRDSIKAYRDYAEEVKRTAEAINEAHGTKNWKPIVLLSEDNYNRSLAALQLSNCLLVNPVRDGLNLVAQEGALVNQRNGEIILSQAAGLAEHIKDFVTTINPFDIVQTAESLFSSLFEENDSTENRANLRSTLIENTPQQWLEVVTGNNLREVF